ncbi:hypothetical protein [uncultured Parabacteroides sp.]|uniref:hypothetical protein n=1 Tax=uncultured Parabacteroides sp. TaxID=512312 RepID=UPI002631D604|nr:hypothetical protein [uncultured Parabacteroides sp.]
MTRRLIPDEFFGLTWDTRGDTLVYENEYGDFIDVRHSKYTRYKVGEVVAVAQRYSTIAAGHPDVDTFLLYVAKAHKIPLEIVQDLAGWNNKMFTKAELMPHRIRITGIKCERLQDISDEDCIKEGLEWDHKARMFYVSLGITNTLREWLGGTPRDAFASLTDMISGSGTWESNPFVTAYEFELVK